MSDQTQLSAHSGLKRNFRDNTDGTYAEEFGSQLRAWNTTSLTWVKVGVDNASGGLIVSGGGGGGGGAVTVADGADVAQGTTTDVEASGNGSVIAILKRIRTLLGALTDGTQRGSMKLLDTGGTNVAAVSAAGRLSVDASGVAVPVTDNAGTLTVDAPVGTPVWVRESDGAAAFVGQKTMAASKPVVIASDQTSIPVAATLSAETTKVIGVVHADDNAGSLTVDAPVGTPLFARLSDGAAALIAQKTMALSLPVTIASDQTALAAPTLTKGTQGATGYSVQELKDAGRVNVALTIEFAFAQTAETLLTVTESRDGAATATFTSKVITSAKRIRFTGGFAIIETLGTGTTVPQRMYLRLRVNTAGATTATSPLQYVWGLGIATGSAAIPVKASTSAPIVIPDGVEYAGNGTVTYGLTLETPDFVATTGTGRCKITLFAFEY